MYEWWHGTPTGDLGPSTPHAIHVGTLRAATQALEARIGIPVTGKWDGTRTYGETKLAGQRTLRGRNESLLTGHNCCDAPEEDYFPRERADRPIYARNQHVRDDFRPNIFPVQIMGRMSNTPSTPMSDTRANATMAGQLKRGTAKRGYYYINEGEDAGSVSAVVPGLSHLVRENPISGVAAREDYPDFEAALQAASSRFGATHVVRQGNRSAIIFSPTSKGYERRSLSCDRGFFHWPKQADLVDEVPENAERVVDVLDIGFDPDAPPRREAAPVSGRRAAEEQLDVLQSGDRVVLLMAPRLRKTLPLGTPGVVTKPVFGVSRRGNNRPPTFYYVEWIDERGRKKEALAARKELRRQGQGEFFTEANEKEKPMGAVREMMEGRHYESAQWLEFECEPATPTPELEEMAREFKKLVLEFLESYARTWSIDTSSLDEDSFVWNAYASLVGHGVGLWEGDGDTGLRGEDEKKIDKALRTGWYAPGSARGRLHKLAHQISDECAMLQGPEGREAREEASIPTKAQLKIINAFREHRLMGNPMRDSISTDGDTIYSYRMPIARRTSNGGIAIVDPAGAPSATTRNHIYGLQRTFTPAEIAGTQQAAEARRGERVTTPHGDRFEVVEYTLPVYWASYLINGDASGLEEGEQEQIDAWIEREGNPHFVDVSEDTHFARRNDATNLGGDVATYTAHMRPSGAREAREQQGRFERGDDVVPAAIPDSEITRDNIGVVSRVSRAGVHVIWREGSGDQIESAHNLRHYHGPVTGRTIPPESGPREAHEQGEPRLQSGYAFYTPSKRKGDWKKIPNDDWEQSMVSDNEIEKANFVGSRLIDGSTFDVFEIYFEPGKHRTRWRAVGYYAQIQTYTRGYRAGHEFASGPQTAMAKEFASGPQTAMDFSSPKDAIVHAQSAWGATHVDFHGTRNRPTVYGTKAGARWKKTLFKEKGKFHWPDKFAKGPKRLHGAIELTPIAAPAHRPAPTHVAPKASRIPPDDYDRHLPGQANEADSRQVTQFWVKLGTLSHNRAFSPQEFAEYTGEFFTIRTLVRNGLIKAVERGRYYPTPEGWKHIERAYGMGGEPRSRKEARENPATDLQDAIPWVRVTRDPERYKEALARAQKIGPIDDAKKVYELVGPALMKEDQETFIVVLIDVRQNCRGVAEIHRGARSRVATSVLDVMRVVVASGAEGFIVVHNHPSGKAMPSEADRSLTKAIERAAKPFAGETAFLDHVVCGSGEYFSFADNKLHHAKN